MERQEAHYGQEGLYYRHGTQKLLQILHQGTKGIDGPPDDISGTQEGQGKEKLQVLKGEDHLPHCGPK